MVFKMRNTKIVVAFITVPTRQSIAHDTLSYRLVIIIIFSRLQWFLYSFLLLSHKSHAFLSMFIESLSIFVNGYFFPYYRIAEYYSAFVSYVIQLLSNNVFYYINIVSLPPLCLVTLYALLLHWLIRYVHTNR
jgi:hypothetical protein